jgi:hypothetical protein
MTKELSPAAQAVLDAAKEICPAPADEIAAAALRAAVEQVLYEEKLGWTGYGYYTHFQNQILAIVDELEAQ